MGYFGGKGLPFFWTKIPGAAEPRGAYVLYVCMYVCMLTFDAHIEKRSITKNELLCYYHTVLFIDLYICVGVHICLCVCVCVCVCAVVCVSNHHIVLPNIIQQLQVSS